MNMIPLDRKAAIIEDAKKSILEGQGLAEIAKRNEISPRTLDYWMAQQPDNEQLRQAWIDNKLIDASVLLDQAIAYANREPVENPETGISERIDVPTGNLRLACARESLRSAQWIAERRDRARYGADKSNVNIVIDIGEALVKARERIVEGGVERVREEGKGGG